MADFDPFAHGAISAGPSPGMTAPPSGAPTTPSGEAPVVLSNPPGFDDLIKQQTTQHTEMMKRAQNYANDMYPLFSAQKELKLAPTGKGSEGAYNASAVMSTIAPEWLQRAASFVTNLGGAIGGGIMTPEETAAYARANKFLTQAQLGVSGATRSNEGGQTASAASPSVNIPKDAAQQVLQGMIGLRRMEHDHALQWQQSGLPLNALNGFVTRLQTTNDPRVYVWDQFTPQQQTKLLDRMTPGNRRAFVAKVDAADRRGIYNTFGMGDGH